MKNLLGQVVNPGDLVYRGARQGDGSEFKIGRVQYLKNGKARVSWLFDLEGWHWRTLPGNVRDNVIAPRRMESTGNPTVGTLVVMPESHFDRLEQIMKLLEQWKDGMSTQAFKDAVDSLTAF